MTADDFIAQLATDGFLEVEHKTVPAGTVLGLHEHAWDARLYVVQGQLTYGLDDTSTTYLPGQHVEVARGRPHTERYDAGETRLVIGRRH